MERQRSWDFNRAGTRPGMFRAAAGLVVPLGKWRPSAPCRNVAGRVSSTRVAKFFVQSPHDSREFVDGGLPRNQMVPVLRPSGGKAQVSRCLCCGNGHPPRTLGLLVRGCFRGVDHSPECAYILGRGTSTVGRPLPSFWNDPGAAPIHSIFAAPAKPLHEQASS